MDLHYQTNVFPVPLPVASLRSQLRWRVVATAVVVAVAAVAAAVVAAVVVAATVGKGCCCG